MISSARFLAIGNWLPQQVTCHWVKSSFDPSARVQVIIEHTWERAMARPGIHLFNGPMVRLESFNVRATGIELYLSQISYKPFFGTNLKNSGLADQYGPGCMANALGISCALVSADNHLILGMRNSQVAYYPDRIHPFAGALEPNEPMDIFLEARRELAEELRFTSKDINQMRCLGLAEDPSLRQPELICFVQSTLDRAEIESRVEAGEHNGSIAYLLSEEVLHQALQTQKELTPVGVAAIEFMRKRLSNSQ
jgi:hypothetical protein